jgi:hypothetical protein
VKKEGKIMITTDDLANQNSGKIQYEKEAFDTIKFLESLLKNLEIDKNSFDLFMEMFLNKMIRLKFNSFIKPKREVKIVDFDFGDRLKNFHSLNYVDFLAVADGLSLRELKEIGFNLPTVPFGIGFNEDKKFILLPNEFHFSYEEDEFSKSKILRRFNEFFSLQSELILDNLVLYKVSKLNSYNEVFDNSTFSFKIKDGIDNEWFYKEIYKKFKNYIRKEIKYIINVRTEDYSMLLSDQFDDKLLGDLTIRLNATKKSFRIE